MGTYSNIFPVLSTHLLGLLCDESKETLLTNENLGCSALRMSVLETQTTGLIVMIKNKKYLSSMTTVFLSL